MSFLSETKGGYIHNICILSKNIKFICTSFNKVFLVPDSCKATERNGSSIRADVTDDIIENDKNGSTLKKKRKIKQVIEEDVYLGQLPLMTDTGTFVIKPLFAVIGKTD
jgi:hypothetical protein